MCLDDCKNVPNSFLLIVWYALQCAVTPSIEQWNLVCFSLDLG